MTAGPDAPGSPAGDTRRRRWGAVRRQGGDAVWTAVDQGLSAGSNLLISIAAGRAGGERLLGQFTLAFTAYLLALGFSRALFSEPLLSLPLTADRGPERSAVTSVLGFSVAVAGVSAVVGAAVHVLPLVALAAVLPALLVQDLLRFAAFRRRAARAAVALDGIWLAVLLLLLPVITGVGSAAVLVLLWGLGALLAAGWGLRRGWPAPPRAAWRWWHRDARAVGGLLVVDSAVYSVTAQGTVFALAALLGTADLGRLRAAQLLLGPATTLLVAFNAFVLPRLASRARQVAAREALLLCGVSAGVSAVAVGLSVAARPVVQRLFFGGRLDVAVALVAVAGATVVVQAASAGLVLHLKALRELRAWTVVRSSVLVVSVPVVLGTAAARGLLGALTAMLVMAALAAGGDAAAWRWTVRRAARP